MGYNANVGYTRFTENYSYGTAFIPSATSSISSDLELYARIDKSRFASALSYLPVTRMFTVTNESVVGLTYTSGGPKISADGASR